MRGFLFGFIHQKEERFMKRLIFCLFGLFILGVWVIGCSVPLGTVLPKHEYGKDYDLGVTKSVNTGATMITVYNLYLIPTYRPKYSYQPRMGFRKLPIISPDQIWTAKYSLGNNYVISSKRYIIGRDRHWGIEVKQNGEIGNATPFIDITPTNVNQPRTGPSNWKLPDPQLFLPLEGSFTEEGSFKAELIYNGISKDTIMISYREFTKNFARPAFYQELRYDLNESDLITFKSLKIKVLDADNNQIRFQVVDDGGLPWMPRT
jgi:hypothetical protein